MRRILAIAWAALMLLGCGGQNPSAPEEPAPDASGAEVTITGGRERYVVRYSAIPEGADVLTVALGGKAEEKIALGGKTEGSYEVTGIAEGSYMARLALSFGSSEAVSLGSVSFVVYGSVYESALPEGRVEYAVLSSPLTTISFRPVEHYSYCGYRVNYTSLTGEKSIDFNRSASGSVILSDVASTESVTAAPLFKPEETLEEVFCGKTFKVRDTDPADLPLNDVVDGYRGIWFDLGQAASSYGSKYSGGLGTYTMKHIPMAIYSPVVNRTYFVFGGTPSADRKYLLCMIGCYDHTTGKLQKPRVVMDKGVLGVADPHDDPTLQIDRDGRIWVFVAGRSNKRNGIRYRSRKPYDITSFEYISEDLMAYPQVMYNESKGFFLFFTRYDGVRQLFYRSSEDGVEWTDYKQLASIKEGEETKSGHYQISNICGTKLCTAFNRHINGNVDTRTNIYYVQSTDWGKTWTTADGTPVKTPVTEHYSNCLVRDYQITTETHNCYIKDLNFDRNGNPVILYLTSKNHLTGPDGGTRQWHVIHWTGTEWDESLLTTSTHCYDSGSLWIEGDDWVVIAPTDAGPQYWGSGGEVVKWRSTDQGKTWVREATVTSGSTNNQTYVRRPWNAAPEFYAFWADGNPDQFTQSFLYFCTKDNQVFRMPYDMTEEWAKPEKL